MEGYEASFKDMVANSSSAWVGTTILNKGQNHYILFKVMKRSVEIIDPIDGQKSMSIKKFEKLFSGLVITIAKGEYKELNVDISSPFRYLSSKLPMVSWIFGTVLLGIVLTFASTVFMKLILDKILPGSLTNTLTIVVIGFSWMVVLRVFNGLLKRYLSKKLTLKIEWTLTDSYFYKLRNCHLSDLNKLTNSDHLRRLSLIGSVSQFISNSIFIIFTEIITFVIAISLLIWISPVLFGITLGATGLIATSTIIFQLFIKEKYEPLLKCQMDYFANSIDNIMSLYELKEPKINDFLTTSHNDAYRTFKTKEFSIWTIATWQTLVSELIAMLTPIALTWISIKYVMHQELTIGSMMMFLAVFNSFINPVEQLCSLALSLPRERKHMNLLSYILNLKAEPKNEKGICIKKIKSIEFSLFEFGYDKPMFTIPFYKIKKNIHISGPNGSGKSTLLHIIASKYSGNGNIKYNDLDKDFINISNLRDQIYITHPMSYFPNTSIYEFITLNNQKAMKLFNENIVNFNLNKLMKQLGITFEQLIINNGENLSSGQKQLISILRLFAFKYSLVIIDEGVENIDKEKVVWLSKALKQVQKCLYIEVSHSKKYLSPGKEVPIEQIIEST